MKNRVFIILSFCLVFGIRGYANVLPSKIHGTQMVEQQGRPDKKTQRTQRRTERRQQKDLKKQQEQQERERPTGQGLKALQYPLDSSRKTDFIQQNGGGRAAVGKSKTGRVAADDFPHEALLLGSENSPENPMAGPDETIADEDIRTPSAYDQAENRQEETPGDTPSSQGIKWWQWVLLIGVAFVFIHAKINERTCPRCGKKHAMQDRQKSFLGRNRKGDREIQVQRKCRYCGYEDFKEKDLK